MGDALTLALPAAATWRAESYRWFYDGHEQPQGLEAEPGVLWKRFPLTVSYEPNRKDRHPERGAHARFLEIKQVRADKGAGPGPYQDLVKRFADWYGLLGLFQDAVSAPVLPSRVEPLFSWVAPDALVGNDGRLREIDPAAEGKERLEQLLYERHGPSARTGRKVRIGADRLALPHELRFLSRGLTSFGRLDPVIESHDPSMLSWEDAKELYGVYAVLDETAESGVSYISTREPLSDWDTEVRRFPSPPCSAESLVPRTEGVSFHPVPGPDGKSRPGLRCPSLLKVLYAMLFVDAMNDNELRKCEASGCPHYFSVGTRDKARKSCPHPEDPSKESRCGQRVRMQRYREKQRLKQS